MDIPSDWTLFSVDDIRKIREANSLRHVKMTPAEIVADTKAGAAELLEVIRNRTTRKNVTILSSEHADPIPL